VAGYAAVGPRLCATILAFGLDMPFLGDTWLGKVELRHARNHRINSDEV
jgi:hypothetical protein